jgi:hypothetical protein
MFSAPTTTITNGRIYVGSVVGVLELPQPFHPSSARTEKDITDEQQSWTMPVKASPKREWTFDAFESCAPRTEKSTR